jgi:hypothetical protein
MKRTTALIAAAVVLTLAACQKANQANMNEESTPAASPAPAPGMAPESAATTTPMATPADTTHTMGADTGMSKGKM